MTSTKSMPEFAFTFALAASTLIDGLVALRLLSRPLMTLTSSRREPAIGLLRTFVAGAGTAVVFLVKLPFLLLVGVDFFGMIHLAYLDLVVLLPAVGLVVLAWDVLRLARLGGRRVTPAVRILAVAALGMAPLGYYATFVEPFRLELERVTVALPEARAGRAGLRVGVLADLQTSGVTGYEWHAVERLMALEPDMILIPGDLFQGRRADFEAELSPLSELVRRLFAPAGVYFVTGNSDREEDLLARAFESSSVIWLSNEARSIEIRDRKVTVGGFDPSGARDASAQLVRRLESDPGQEDIRILMGHYPDAVLDLSPDSRIDLVVAGHTHGGQVQLPFFGPPLTLSKVPRRVGAGGLHELDGRSIYVSRGVGCERGQAPRIRFLCWPEITLLELR